MKLAALSQGYKSQRREEKKASLPLGRAMFSIHSWGSRWRTNSGIRTETGNERTQSRRIPNDPNRVNRTGVAYQRDVEVRVTLNGQIMDRIYSKENKEKHQQSESEPEVSNSRVGMVNKISQTMERSVVTINMFR